MKVTDNNIKILPLMLVVLISLLCNINLLAQKHKHTISGTVVDSKTNNPLYLASVAIEGSNIGDATDINGNFLFNVEEGSYTLSCTFVGYQTYTKKINVKDNITLNIKLKPKVVSSDVFEVTSKNIDKNVSSVNIGVVELPVKKLEKLPVVFGEADILKTIQLLPGVQSGGEGSNTFFVRGGGSDQNLITLDGATIYNPSHAAGFFSVFNTNIINSAEIYKGGMAPEYGSRMSSVIDVKTKDGSKEEYKGKLGVGLLSSHVLVEGPIQKGKSSFIFGARRTYADLIIKPFSKGTDFEGTNTYFYDLNGKLSFTLGKKDFLTITGFYSKDIFNFNPDKSSIGYNMNWKNAVGVINWSHFFTNNLTLNTSAKIIDYKLQLDGHESAYSMDLYSGVRDYSISSKLTWKINNNNTIKVGADYTHHTFKPHSVSASSLGTQFDINKIDNYYASDASAFVQHEVEFLDKFKILYGLRYNYYAHIGPFTRYQIDNYFNFNNIDSTIYKPFQTIKGYHLLEPRFNFRYSIDSSQSIKFSYTLNRQGANMVPMSSMILPTDVWYPATELIKPQMSNQISLGYFKNFLDNKIETSIELYYKKMNNLLESNIYANFVNSYHTNPDYMFIFGEGQSYGIELFANKNYGNLTGWISYTLSKTTRNFEQINNGEPFYARYDRRHDISILLDYKLNDKWSFSTVWVYFTGNAVTLPNSFYIINGSIVVEYGDYNGWRMPNYHRLDLSANWKVIDKKNLKGLLNFSIYNAYSRKNAYMISFVPETNDDGIMQYKANKITIFPILPSISFNLEFN